MVDKDEEELELDEEANMTEETGGAGDNATIPSRKKYRFNADWQKTFPWLFYENELMYCKYCKAQKHAAEKSVFVTGNANFKQDNLVKHSKSHSHKIQANSVNLACCMNLLL